MLASLAASAAAYTRITAVDGRATRWASMPVSYWINVRGFSQIPNGSEFSAVRAAFQTWQDVPTADIVFDYKGTTPVQTVGRDGINLISFADDATVLGSSTLAATFSFFCSTCPTFQTQEADIIFNKNFNWTTSGEAGKYDIQAVLTHEIGHLLGLDHSALVSSVMTPFAAVNSLDLRTLQYDDMAGVAELYPKASNPPVGSIQGRITAGSAPVFGAHVVAVDTDGTALVSTLSVADGSYTLRFLPPGDYRIYAEPMDMPVNDQNLGGFYRNLKTDFGTTYSGNVARLADARAVTVSASSIASMDISVLPKSATSLNVTRPSVATRIVRGSGNTLILGGFDLTAGATFSSSNSGIILGAPFFSTSTATSSPTIAVIGANVNSFTPLGPKNIAVNRGTDAAALSGAIVVIDPQPTGIVVQPSIGSISGHTRVAITGNNFRTGARVYFAGLEATDVHFIDSGNLDALTPANIPGVVNVQVINRDGTNGMAPAAFNFLAQPPLITNVSPRFGPPATVVTIDGDRFDIRPENNDVKFNGVNGRVLTSSATSLQVIVPYGATTGPVTVTVFGQTAAGPSFTVTPIAPSSNVAPSVYRFVDASLASGGTGLAFNSNDDAIALVDLPFNFSLFRDIYLAGSKISVATNGFLSLQTISGAEFQNGPLPGSSVTRPGGSAGTTPQSLIAPFFDDLLLLPGVSSVSTRLTGEAPNRQFVIEWSNLSILDDSGLNLNASVTFEAILFEGSNDIQFVYVTANGQRSDGSGATIGVQDLQRTTGIQTGFNQPIIHTGSFITYRFGAGQYMSSASILDASAPSRPVVIDTGAATNSSSQLIASWTADDPESGVVEYQYAIGTTPGGVEVRAFTTTDRNGIVETGLSLQAGPTYYFAVRAVNGAGLTSEIGVSDGIRIDPTYQGQKQYLPYAPQDSSQFTGIALFAPASMTVTLTAVDANGNMIVGTAVRNPATISLAAGQQYTKLISELFGLARFDGWIEVESSSPGLSTFLATGAWNMSQLDNSVPRALSTDFVAEHSGALLVLVNPSNQAAMVSMSAVGATTPAALTIPARGSSRITLTGPTRIISSTPLGAIETLEGGGRLSIFTPESVSSARDSFVFPFAMVGGGYSTLLTLTNPAASSAGATISFGSASQFVTLPANSSQQFSIANLLQLPTSVSSGGALRVSTSGNVLAALDITNSLSSVSMTDAVPAVVTAFPYLVTGNGFFTGFAFASGNMGANVTVEIYPASGGPPKTGTFVIGPNQQIARLVSELVSGLTTQTGGYVRIVSDQPISSVEIIGSSQTMGIVPPL